MGFNPAQGGGGGGSGSYLPLAGGTMDDGANVVLGSTTGTKVGTVSTQKLGFLGATPIVRASDPGPAAFSGVYASDGNTIVQTLNSLRTTLTNYGLIG